MSEVNKALAQRWTEEIWSQGNMAAIDELVATEYAGHDPLMPDIRGHEGLKQLVATVRAAFPDGRFTEDELIAEGDKVVARWTFTGTHKGEWLGVAPTGQPATITGTVTLRVSQGKVAETWEHWDALGWIQRTGAMGDTAALAANKALVRRYMEEVLNKGDSALIEQIFADGAVWRPRNLPEMQGLDARKQFVMELHTAYPDIRFTIDELIGEGDRVVLRWTFSGTHKGEWMGIAPSGKAVAWGGTTTFRISGGKITDEFVDWDALGGYQQLGVVPPLTQAIGQAAG